MNTDKSSEFSALVNYWQVTAYQSLGQGDNYQRDLERINIHNQWYLRRVLSV